VARQTSTIITERKTRLDGSTTEFVCEPIVLEPGKRAVLRYVSDREWAVADTDIRVPRIEPDLVAYTDLVVDVLLRPSGAADVLDEDELPHDLAPAHRLAIAKALEVLIANPRFLIREIEQETAAALALRVEPPSHLGR